ncbi:MAG: hypothetical protein ACXACX_15400 [Candidatus Hodarchaeales archaeon]
MHSELLLNALIIINLDRVVECRKIYLKLTPLVRDIIGEGES